MLTRLGGAEADVFTIVRIAGRSSVTESPRYVHPMPEGMERAFGRRENLNAVKFEQAEAAEARRRDTNLGTVKKATPPKSSQVVEFKSPGP